MAYCSQSPWLQSGTIRAAIIGNVDDKLVDEAWYHTVLETCALTYDISKFRLGDQTLIGSRGITLSGGQKHRVALARALYARPDVFVLDDVLSALDKRTEKAVADKLFGTNGVFQNLGATVIMVTHASEYLSRSSLLMTLTTKFIISPLHNKLLSSQVCLPPTYHDRVMIFN
jgi:ATP-binding cassette subfamily C (CFTR/MRP) protein 1